MTATSLLVTATVVVLFLVCASATPMLYKRNQEEKFEADLVPVSSTVIPLTVLEVSYGVGGMPSEEYKAAYLRKLRKQVLQRQRAAEGESVGEATVALEDTPPPADVDKADAGDTLITVKSQQLEPSHRAKVKDI